MRRWSFGASVSLALALLATGPLDAAEPVKSGPQPGESLPGSFEPYNVTGEHAGERYCLVCASGLRPAVMIFARTLSAPLQTLLRRLDAATGEHAAEGLSSFAVFLSDEDGLERQLTQAAQRLELKQTVLSLDAPEGPAGYRLAEAADVTVVLYEHHRVQASHAFRAGELTTAASDAVLADLAKILPAP